MPRLATALALACTFLVPPATALAAGGAARMQPVTALLADASGVALREPESVAYDGQSRVVVADTGNGRLVQATVTGDVITAGAALALPQLPVPLEVVFRPSGELLVLDGSNRRIGRVSTSGEFRGYLEVAPATGTEAVLPRSVRVDARDNVYVLDPPAGRILVLGPDGKLAREIAFPRERVSLTDLAVDSSGIYAIDAVGRQVYAARGDAKVLALLGGPLPKEGDFPASLAADGRGTLLVADRTGGIATVAPDGSFRGVQLAMGWKTAELRFPADLTIAADGRMLVADRGNNRVQMFSLGQ